MAQATARDVQTTRSEGAVGGDFIARLPGQKETDAPVAMVDPVFNAFKAAEADAGKPEVDDRPAEMPAPEEHVFRFRTKVGHRGPGIRIPAPPPADHPYWTKQKDDRKIVMQKTWERRFGRSETKRYTAMVERLGTDVIQFKPLTNKLEAVFETDDPEIAAFIRSKISEYPYIYEEMAPMTVMVNGVEVRVVPADDASRAALGGARAR